MNFITYKLTNFILCLYLFVWASMPYKYWIISTIILSPLLFKSYYNKFTNNNLIYLLLIFLFYFFIYAYGFNNISIAGDKSTVILSILIQAIILFLIFGRINKDNNSKNLVLSVAYGFILHGLISSAYTYFIVGRQAGLGSLFNPIYGDLELGSALVSNYMTAATLIIFFLVENKAVKWLLISISAMICFYLIARSYFMISGLILFLQCVLYYKKNFFRFVNYFILILLFGITYYTFLPSDTINFVIDTYAQKGVDSLRWLHWEYALSNFANYPFGGLSVNHSIEDIDSFHNIFIDSYRMAGFFGITLLLAIIILPLFNMVKNENLLIYLGLILVLSQDVIFEGGQKLLTFTVIFVLLSNQIRLNRTVEYQ